MDIRLKNKVKKYFNNVWLIEILLVIVITGICMDALIKYKNSPLSKDIYDRTDGLKKLLYSTEQQKDEIRKEIFNNSFYSKSNSQKELPEGIYFIIRNKYNDDIFTNDPFFEGVKKVQGDSLYKVIEEKYKGDHIITYSCNNVNLFNDLINDPDDNILHKWN